MRISRSRRNGTSPGGFFSVPYRNIPPGGKPRQRFERFEQKCRFRHSETADSFPKMVLKIPGILKCFFNDDLSLTGNLCLKTRTIFFFHSHCHTILQGLTCDLHQTFGRGVHPTPLPHPDASHQLWVNMAVGSGRGTAWYGRLR